MRISLGALLAAGLAGLQLIAVLAVVFFSYVTSERSLLTHANTLLNDVGFNVTEHSKGFLKPARSAAELAAKLSENRIFISDNPDILERFLFEQLLIAPQFAGLYFGTNDGGFVMVTRSVDGGPFLSKVIRGGDRQGAELIWRDGNFREIEREFDPADEFDPRERNWFQRAIRENQTVWTDPYIFFTSQQPGITLSSPVMNGQGGFRGVVGVDIEISSISGFLANLRIGENGKALIINRNGDVIAHPSQELLKAEHNDGSHSFVNIREFRDPIAREAFSSLSNGFDTSLVPEDNSKFTYQGKTYLSTIMPITDDNLPWVIGVYAPENDFVGKLKESRAISIWIAVLVAAITGICGLVLANYIHRPVRAFAVRSSLIAQGEIDPAEPMPRTYKELSRANENLVQEIVARKKTEREYGQTFDLSSRGMAQIAPETGEILRANAKFCEITGYSASEISHMRYEDLLHPDEPAELSADFFATKNDFAERHEVRFMQKEGGTIDIAVNAILIRDYYGNPLHAVVTVDDITESKEQENQIARLNRDLYQMARGHTMGQMASGLAHELNQPLAAIAQNADTALLLADSTPGNPRALQEILTEIEQQSLRAGDIIRALRGFIMKDANDSTTFDISELIDQAERLVTPEARGAGVTIQRRTGPLPLVHANRIQVAQVIVNLLRNAIEAIAESGLERRRIAVKARQIGEKLEIAVEDTGPGIDPDIRLFTQFETNKKQGMGLGLTICRSMIEANGGELWLDETYSRGARFCFTLPVESRQPDLGNTA